MFVSPLNRDILSLATRLSQHPGFAWIDSAAGGDFSILAWNPDRKKVFRTLADADAFAQFLGGFPAAPGRLSGARGFSGGWIGYVSYEAFAFSNVIPIKPGFFKNYPLAAFYHYEDFVYADHLTGSVSFVTTAANGEARFYDFLRALETPAPVSAAPRAGSPRMSTSKARYHSDFNAVKESLADGEFFELNYTAGFSAPFAGDAFPLYLTLRDISPAPFMAFLNFDELAILSASPECFFSCAAGVLRSHPIKGTAKRGGCPTTDAAAKRALEESAKDRAELLMVTDMVRNDLGRVCETGSVRVTELGRLETFSHCHHLVATIEGAVAADKTLLDVFNALFPGGSITGAPKIKVMEKISSLENRARGVYTGAVGFISENGFAEFNIPIRTMTLKEGCAEFAAGGGLTIDSDFESEFAECLVKAQGMIECLEKTRS